MINLPPPPPGHRWTWVLVERKCVRCDKPQGCIVQPYGLECIPCWAKFRDAKPD